MITCQRCARRATWAVTSLDVEAILCTLHKNQMSGGTHRPLAPKGQRSWRKMISPPDGIPR